MFKSQLVVFLIFCSVVFFVIHSFGLGESGEKTDSVFLDEGDGDFDKTPILPNQGDSALTTQPGTDGDSTEKTVSNATAKTTQTKKDKMKNGKDAKVQKNSVNKNSGVVKTQATLPHKKQKLPKDPQSESKDPGVYVTTKESCPMTRQPASESEVLLRVKPAKKIWAQKVEGGKWYRAFNKAGEPGYIEEGCVSAQ